jgi:hypothetical protein
MLLQITHEIFFAPPNPFLDIILQLPISKTRLNSIPLLLSSYPGRLAFRNSTLFFTTPVSLGNFLHNNSAQSTQKTQPHYCWEGVFLAPLHSNGSYSIVSCVLVAAGMCLPSRCLAINVYSDFVIPTFGHHVTICKYVCSTYINHFSDPNDTLVITIEKETNCCLLSVVLCLYCMLSYCSKRVICLLSYCCTTATGWKPICS